jgi:hypothetical protein
MSQEASVLDLEKYKADQARARDLGFDYAQIRNIILQANSDEEDGISVGKAIEIIREIGLRAADRAIAEERAAVVAHLRERAIHGAGNIVSVEDACTILADLFERGEHRHEEEK